MCHSALQILSTSVRLQWGQIADGHFLSIFSLQMCVGVLPEGEPPAQSEALTSATASSVPPPPHTPDQVSWPDHQVLLLLYSALYYH